MIMKISREQIQETIKALNKELKEHNNKLNALMMLKNENVCLLTFRDEVGESVAHIDEWISSVQESIADTKTNIDLFNKLLESYYC